MKLFCVIVLKKGKIIMKREDKKIKSTDKQDSLMEELRSYMDNKKLYDSKKLTIEIEDSYKKENDWDIASSSIFDTLNNEKLEKTINQGIDWRSIFPNNWKVYEQRENECSCVSYATTDLVHFHLLKLGYKVRRLSARFNWIAAKEIDELQKQPTTFILQAGTTLKAGLDVCRKYGSVDDELLLTDENSMFDGTVQDFYSQASRYKIQSYYNLMVSNQKIINNISLKEKSKRELQIIIWKTWLSYGPILVRVNVDKNFYNADKKPLKDYEETKVYQKHAALIVGYNKKGEFILRNSWGTSWGDNGYALLLKDYALDALDEAYGIVVASSFGGENSNEVGGATTTSKPSKPTTLEKLLLALGIYSQ